MPILLLLLTFLAGCATQSTPSCDACAMIEKHGDDSAEQLKAMSPAELSLKDNDGYTPFYWSIYHGAKKARNVLVEKLPRRGLLDEPVHHDLMSVRARSRSCTPNSLEVLNAMGFKADAQSLPAALTNNEACSKEKFDRLMELKAPFRAKDAQGNNLFHLIVLRAQQGRPKADLNCLIHGIKRVRRITPMLLKEKNKAGRTPSQLTNAKELGTGVTRKEMQTLARALR